MKKRIIFFTKAPAPGYGKSRLRGFLSEQATYELTVRLITENFTAVIMSGIPAAVYYAGEKENLAFVEALAAAQGGIATGIAGSGVSSAGTTGTGGGDSGADVLRFEVQQGCGLGEKMFNACRQELQTADAVVLMGSDLSGITAEVLHGAFTALENTDVVIAPAQDGGYGIIGMKKPHDVFSGITFSTASVYEDTCACIRRQGLSYTPLSSVRDIDTPEDLAVLEVGGKPVQLIGQGEYNINYRFDEHYVLRINTASQLGLGNRQIEYEFRCLQALEASGVTPKVYRYSLHGQYIPYGVLVMEYISGRPLSYHTDMETAAFLLAQVHNCPISSAAPFIRADQPFAALYEECCRMYAHYTAWDKKESFVCEYIERFFTAALAAGLDDHIENACIINTELNNRNFIIGESKENSRIIDWEKPLIGECEQDLAHFLAPTTTHWKTETLLSAQERENFLSMYEVYRPVNRIKFRKYLLFNCLRGITWCCMARVEYASQRAVSNPETFERIQEFLSRRFLHYLCDDMGLS